jgi:hypothetical protein
MSFQLSTFGRFFANDTSAYNPKLWAFESIALLWERMGMGSNVNVDFNPVVASFGETVTTRKVNKFKVTRKNPNDNVTVQDASATPVNVTLNQLPHVSFTLNDSEMSKSFKDLVTEFLEPATWTMASAIDRILYSQFAQFLPNGVGRLGNLNTSNVRNYMLEARNVMNMNNVPDMGGRNLFWTPASETVCLSTDIFLEADKRGDGGQALTVGNMGTLLGFNNFMTQNAPRVIATTNVKGAINLAAGYAAGTKTFTVDGLTAAIAAGTFITIAGDDTPLRVVSTVGGATPTSITVSTGTKYAVVDNAVVTVYTPAAVNLAAGYLAGHGAAIKIDGASIFPSQGQMVTFDTSATGAIYVVVSSDSSAGEILLDRPLETSLADNTSVNLGPAGDFNFAFDRDAIMLVNRPLAMPAPGTGANSFVAMTDNFALRVTITYDGRSQSHLITIDTLLGVAVRDVARGVPLYG